MLVLLHDAANCHFFYSTGTDLDAALPTATADRVQLQQVLLNLMLNGIEAMEGESGELKRHIEEDRRWSIADFGE